MIQWAPIHPRYATEFSFFHRQLPVCQKLANLANKRINMAQISGSSTPFCSQTQKPRITNIPKAKNFRTSCLLHHKYVWYLKVQTWLLSISTKHCPLSIRMHMQTIAQHSTNRKRKSNRNMPDRSSRYKFRRQFTK